MGIGVFSVSLTVKDLAASKAFYEKLGFSAIGGEAAQNWLILSDGDCVIGLFCDLERCSLRPGNVHSANGWRNVLEPVVERYRERNLRRYFRGDAAFAAPDIYEFPEDEGFLYAIRLKANAVLQECIAHLLTRPVGRPPNHVRRYYASFSYQAGSWNKKRRVIAKVEWHPGELYPRVGFIVTNLSRPAERVVAFLQSPGDGGAVYQGR